MLKNTLIFFFYLFVFSTSPVSAQWMTPQNKIDGQIMSVRSNISNKEHRVLMLQQSLDNLNRSIAKATEVKNYNLVSQYLTKKEIIQNQLNKANIELSELKMQMMVLESERRLMNK